MPLPPPRVLTQNRQKLSLRCVQDITQLDIATLRQLQAEVEAE